MNFSKDLRNRLVMVIVLLSLLHLTAGYSFLLFHSLAEIFSIVIAFTLFVISWNSRRYIENQYIQIIGIAYLFIGFMDLLHTLGYTGMNIFPDYDFLGNQLWIAARYTESVTLLAGFFLLRKKYRFPPTAALILSTFTTSLFLLSIFYWRNFPACFIEGIGQTPFKIISEYIIITILFIALITFFRKRHLFSERIRGYLALSLVFTILSEFAFTLYLSNYGLVNMIGHYFKIASFYCIYLAVIEKGIKIPYDLIFHELVEQKKELENANATKNKLFSIIAHDLRGPVAAWAKAIELTLDPDMDDCTKMPILEELHKSAGETYSLLEKLLYWAGTLNHSIEYKPDIFSLSEILDSASSSYTAQALAKNISIRKDYGKNLNAFGDHNMVSFIIRNFISNCIKFSWPEGKITVSAEHDKDKVRIFVADTGTGLTEEEIRTILHPASPTGKSKYGTSGEKGTGLGIRTCIEFLELHGSQLSIQSEPGKGSRFSFELQNSSAWNTTVYRQKVKISTVSSERSEYRQDAVQQAYF